MPSASGYPPMSASPFVTRPASQPPAPTTAALPQTPVLMAQPAPGTVVVQPAATTAIVPVSQAPIPSATYYPPPASTGLGMAPATGAIINVNTPPLPPPGYRIAAGQYAASVPIVATVPVLSPPPPPAPAAVQPATPLQQQTQAPAILAYGGIPEPLPVPPPQVVAPWLYYHATPARQALNNTVQQNNTVYYQHQAPGTAGTIYPYQMTYPWSQPATAPAMAPAVAPQPQMMAAPPAATGLNTGPTPATPTPPAPTAPVPEVTPPPAAAKLDDPAKSNAAKDAFKSPHPFDDMAIQGLNRKLNDGDPGVRADAAFQFYQLMAANRKLQDDPRYMPYVDAFIRKILNDPNAMVHQPVLLGLQTGEIVHPSKEVIARLKDLKHDEGMMNLEPQFINDALSGIQESLGALPPLGASSPASADLGKSAAPANQSLTPALDNAAKNPAPAAAGGSNPTSTDTASQQATSSPEAAPEGQASGETQPPATQPGSANPVPGAPAAVNPPTAATTQPPSAVPGPSRALPMASGQPMNQFTLPNGGAAGWLPASGLQQPTGWTPVAQRTVAQPLPVTTASPPTGGRLNLLSPG
jgi:hypothetical protein